jgi:hypothetical protein
MLLAARDESDADIPTLATLWIYYFEIHGRAD